MSFKTSCFNVCGPMIRENLRRFWPIPVIGFLVYFLSGIFPVLMNYKDLRPIADYIELTFQGRQPFFAAAHLWLPIISAVLVFRYLHSSSSVSVMHAMPFTRRCLYGSNVLSGLILSASPAILTGLLFLCLARPVYQKHWIYDEVTGKSTAELVNVFSRQAVCGWIWQSLVVILFIFAAATLAGILTGNGLMHFLAAVALPFLAPLLYSVFIEYFSEFLLGFTTQGSSTDYFLSLSPWLEMLGTEDGGFSPVLTAVYLCAAAVCLALGLILYHKSELERAGDSLVFRFTEPIVCGLITFFSMTIFGLYFSMLKESDLYRYAGYVAGTLVGFLVAQMIVSKTVRVFNLKSARRFAAYCFLAFLFLICLKTDVVGFEQRIPEASRVASVAVDQDYLNLPYYHYKDEKPSDEQNTFREQENIRLVTEFHRRLIDDRALYEKVEDGPRCTYLTFRYTLNDGSRHTRRYSVPLTLLRSYTQLSALYESSEFLRPPAIASLPAGDFNYLNITSDTSNTFKYGNTYENVGDQQKIHELAQALSADLTGLSYEDMTFSPIPLCYLEFGYADRTKNKEKVDRLRDSATIRRSFLAKGKSESFTVYPNYTHTIGWLEKNGYGDFAKPAGEFALYMAVEHADDGAAEADAAASTETTESRTPYWDRSAVLQADPPVSDANTLIISDREAMLQLLDRCETTILDYNDYYPVTVVCPPPNGAQPYGDGSFRQFNFFLNSAYAPDEIKEYFK